MSSRASERATCLPQIIGFPRSSSWNFQLLQVFFEKEQGRPQAPSCNYLRLPIAGEQCCFLLPPWKVENSVFSPTWNSSKPKKQRAVFASRGAAAVSHILTRSCPFFTTDQLTTTRKRYRFSKTIPLNVKTISFLYAIISVKPRKPQTLIFVSADREVLSQNVNTANRWARARTVTAAIIKNSDLEILPNSTTLSRRSQGKTLGIKAGEMPV